MNEALFARAAVRQTSVSPPAEEFVVEVRNLDFFYGDTQVLFDVDMPVARNRITALIGPSGCGKSTLLRVLNRIYDLYPDQHATGRVLFHGSDVLTYTGSIARLRARVGMVFQKPMPFPMSIYDNVAYGVRLYHRKSRAEMDLIVERSLRRAALWDEVKDKLRTPGRDLSGGQQQRLCVARSIAVEPQLLLLDEPASSCDPISTAKLEETIMELKQDTSVVIVTHNLQEAARISDYAGFMFLGRMIEFGPAQELFINPRQKQTREFVTGRFG